MKFNLRLIYFLFIILLYKPSDLLALTLDESIDEAIKNNQEIKILEDKLKNLELSHKLIISEFLPKISANYQRGRRYTKSSVENMSDLGGYDSKEINIEQNIFSGFSSLIALSKNHKEYLIEFYNLNDKKQNIASQVAQCYINIIWQEKILQNYYKIVQIYQEIIKIENLKIKARISAKDKVLSYKNELLSLNQKIKEEESILAKNRADFLLLSNIFAQNLTNIEFNKIGFAEIDIDNYKISKLQILEKVNNNFLLQAKYLQYQITLDEVNYKIRNFSPKVTVVASFSKQDNNIFWRNQNLLNKSLGLNISIPLFQKGEEYIDLQSAKNLRHLALENYQLYKQNISAELSKNCDDFIFLTQNIQFCEDVLSNHLELEEMIKSRLLFKDADLVELYFKRVDIENQKIKCFQLNKVRANSYFKIIAQIGDFNV